MKLLLLLGALTLFAEDERIARIEQAANIPAMLRTTKVPAASIAVIDSGKLVWAKAWGEGVNTGTVFQAASISKPVAAMAALHMMQYGNFDLDEDVNNKLQSWKVRSSRPVTLRGLLSHSAGITVHGFPGYAFDATVPTTLEVLNGEPPANTTRIYADIEPGSQWRYSGGGFTVLQLLLSEKIGWPFPQLMQRMVLGKIGMKRSTYEQPLPNSWVSDAAAGHLKDGSPVKGRWHTYPEMAAAGLWTTPTDLALWAIELRESYFGRSNRVIERKTAEEMLTRQSGEYGLGLRLTGEGKSRQFSHGGANHGYRCVLAMYLETGKGFVLMTNGDRGTELFAPIRSAIAAEYGWPE